MLFILVRKWRYYIDFIQWMFRMHKINIFANQANLNLFIVQQEIYILIHIVTVTQINIMLKMAKITNTIQVIAVFLFVIEAALTLDCQPFGVRLNLGTYFVDALSQQKLAIRFNTKIGCQKSYVTIQKDGSSIRKVYCDSSKVTFDNYTTFVQKCSIVDIAQGDNIQYMVFGWTGNTADPQIPYLSTPIPYYFQKNVEDFKMVSLADWSYLRDLRTKYKPLDQSFDYLLKYDSSIRAIFINGDVAYDLQSNNGRNYEDFLKMISQVTVRWALIINPGNHQHRDQNYDILVKTFQTYGFLRNRVVQLRLPWFNFILFDPYQILYNKEPQNKSISAFRNELSRSYEAKNLAVLASHYPFRCNGQVKDCETKHQQMSQFFKAMFQFNVPLYLGAHFHAYQRHYPFKADDSFNKTSQVEWWYNKQVENRTLISVVEGVAGNDLSMAETYDNFHDFTAAYSYNVTGYGIVQIGPLRLNYWHYTSDNSRLPVDSFDMFLRRTAKLNLRVQ